MTPKENATKMVTDIFEIISEYVPNLFVRLECAKKLAKDQAEKVKWLSMVQYHNDATFWAETVKEIDLL